MDLYGQEEAVNQLNSRNDFVQNYNQGVADFNNRIMTEYKGQKDSEGQTDGLTYATDVLNNVMSGAGMKGAFDNHKYELNRAKNIASRLAKDTVEGISAIGEVKDIAGQKLINTVKTSPAGGLSGAFGGTKTDTVFLPDKGQFPADNPDRPPPIPTEGAGVPPPIPTSGAGVGTEPTRAPDTPTEPTPATEPPKAGMGVVVTDTPAKPGEPRVAGANALKTDAEAEADGEGHGIVAHALNKVTGIGLDAGENVAKFGGAITSAGMGGVSLYGDIKNMVDNHGDPFKKDASWEDDVNNVGSIVQGVSDVVGVIPGLEWVAGLGNLVGAGTSAIGMFGDHDKNVQHDKNVEDMKNQLKTQMQAPSSAGEVLTTAPSQVQQQVQKSVVQGSY
tara:strand:- start:3756 stop:4922 length:1167 start_codon:yes stop_codon:yes gene_type:complete